MATQSLGLLGLESCGMRVLSRHFVDRSRLSGLCSASARVGRHGRAKSLPEGDALNRFRELSSRLAAVRGHQSLRCCARLHLTRRRLFLMAKELMPRQDRRPLLIPLPAD